MEKSKKITQKLLDGLKNFAKILLVSFAYSLNALLRTNPYDQFQSSRYLEESANLLWKNEQEKEEWLEEKQKQEEKKQLRCLAHPTLRECSDTPVLT